MANYDNAEVCLSMTSQSYHFAKILFSSLSFDVCIIRGRFVILKKEQVEIGAFFLNHPVLQTMRLFKSLEFFGF